MRKKVLSISVVCALSVSTAGYAADDVYVDLSVLDAAPRDSIGFVASQPLFPVYEKAKAPKAKVHRKAKAPVLPPAVKPEPKLEEAVVHEDLNEEKETAKTEIKTIEPETLPEKDTVIEIPAPEEPVVEAKPVSETVEEPVEQPAPISAETPAPAEPEVKELPAAPTEAIEVKEPAAEPIAAVEPIAPAPVVMSATTAELPETSAVVAPKEVYSLSFAPDSSELSSASLQRLEEAVRTFDPEQKKKISIKAHNYDNGEDSFRKKRISLTRATEVRSWFLNRGFKNFSIRVVNSSTDDENRDTVEFEELD